MTGIYKITNKLTNDCYIGLSVDIEKRWQRHKWAYKQPKNNTHLYLAMRKYGIENFSFEVIEQCHKEELQDREIYWINYYDSYNHGYNMTPGGECGAEPIYDYDLIVDYWNQGYGIKTIADFLECSCSTVTQVLKKTNNYIKEEVSKRQHIQCSIPVYQYDLQGKYIQTFNSFHQAAQQVNGQVHVIRKCCDKQFKTAYNYIWRLYKQPQLDLIIELGTINCYDLAGNYLTSFISMAEAEKITGVPLGSISMACRHLAHRGGKFQWRYVTDDTPLKNIPIILIGQYNLQDELINTYPSIVQAAKAAGRNRKTITKALKENKIIDNYKWRYIEDYGGIY